MKKKHHKKPSVEIATPEETEQFAGTEAEQAGRAGKLTGEGANEADQEQRSAGGDADPAEEWKDRFMRAKADFQNLQRRSTEELRTATRYANAEFAKSLLEVADDLERTLEASESFESTASLADGVKIVYGKLLTVLQNNHIKVIEAVGQPFDPKFHEALMQQPSDEHPPNTIIQEVQKGYVLHGRALRPARVIIAAGANEHKPNNDDFDQAQDTHSEGNT